MQVDKLTDNVSIEWMDEQNLTRFNQIGIPNNIYDLSAGITWKPLLEVTDVDREILDNYFDVQLLKDRSLKQKVENDLQLICDAAILSKKLSGSRYASLINTNMELSLEWIGQLCKILHFDDLFSGDVKSNEGELLAPSSYLSDKLDMLINHFENYEFDDYASADEVKVGVAQLNIISKLNDARIWLHKYILESGTTENTQNLNSASQPLK